MEKKSKSAFNKLNRFMLWVDHAKLWWVGIVLLIVVCLPFEVLKGGSVFPVHDQLDESMMNYVLTARHLGDHTGRIPELLGGINASGMQPAAVLFVPLYRYLTPLIAFLIQYGFCFLCGFLGMYFCVKELTSSSILAVAMAGCFSLLPMYPLYGLSEYGIPLILYSGICLWRRKNRAISFWSIFLFGLTSHLVCTGYVVLGFWLLALLITVIWFPKNRKNLSIYLGFVELLTVYLVVNRELVKEFLLGGASYVSHREELVNHGMPFWNTVKTVFMESAQHAPSYHKYLVLPIVLLLVVFFFLKKDCREKVFYRVTVIGFAVLASIAVLYGICNSVVIAAWKNSLHGFFRYFQLERFYWLYPAGWYLEFAMATAVWWRHKSEWRLIQSILLTLILLPTLQLVKENSFLYMNVNQINNGSGITGYISWESYYAEDLMQELEDAIGKDKETYRVVHLGINPSPALMHGFYTVDGYSNNYPLEYKRAFRKVIASELEKNAQVRAYFDDWGSRCYLFNHVTGTYWNLSKYSDVQYSNLEFNMEELRDLGCEYLFSGGEVTDGEKLGLEFMGYFETEKSYWGIWLYKLCEP